MFDSARVEEDVFGTPLSTAPVSLAAVVAAEQAAQRVTSQQMAALVSAVDAVLAQVPVELPEPQALADAAELMAQIERLRAGLLGRVADVDTRRLYRIDGAPSTTSWVAAQQTSLDRGEVALSRRLAALPTLDAAVRDGQLSIASAEQVGKALSKLRRHVDRPDGLIDGQDGEQALAGVIGHGARMVVCQALGSLADDDPRLQTLMHDLAQVVELPVSQYARLEATFVLVAGRVQPVLLRGALGQLVDALLPNEFEKRAADGHDNRGFGLARKHDDSGFVVTDGDLDLELGELLSALIAAEMAGDPDNPADTQAFQQLRDDGWESGDELPGPGCSGPRSLRQRRHDALKNGIRRYLDSGIAGTREKVAPHIGVIVGVDALAQQPGALPAVSTTTGRRLPGSLVRSWLCDSALTRFVVGLGSRVLDISHTERTLRPHERRARRIETGGICQAWGCARPGPIPHHPVMFSICGSTSMRDTVMLCDASHHDVHVGKKTIRLKDGRWLDENGWTGGPAA